MNTNFGTVTLKTRWRRGFAVAVPASVITFGLFTAMLNLIKVDDFEPPELTQFTLDPYMEANKPPVEHKADPKPRRPALADPPPLAPNLVNSVTNPKLPVSEYGGVAPAEYEMGEVVIIPPVSAGLYRDRGMRPLTPPTPVYPTVAATNGTEGSCDVHLSVTPKGDPFDVKAKCTNRVFVRAAERAIKKVRFAPKVRDGKPVTVTGVVYPLEFRMEP